ncbi:hypothetical protein CALVIDRAFT_595201 [Calocera viscosa TUFC12733]|uniref:Uncharacterized protein n=1 Tax=Calocera viscosa (strain TUFC12733) TaxID=1330018 RepID=A0A167QYF1_CALVF|nr:hypothetical protein CALVIDRAFT_595201 [Calocera viscosa TUFC12733]
MDDSSPTSTLMDPPPAKRSRRSPTPADQPETAITPALPLRGLADLPVELLYDILISSASPSLPLLSRRLHAVCASAPPSIRARYLISSFLQLAEEAHAPSLNPPAAPSRPPAKYPLAHFLHYPLCTLPVLLALERLWPTNTPEPEPETQTQSTGSPSPSSPAPVPPPLPALRPTVDLDSAMWNLPKRLFRALPACAELPERARVDGAGGGDRAQDQGQGQGQRNEAAGEAAYPLLSHLLHSYPFNADSHSGYPLAMSVRASHLPLVRLLLQHRANPGLKDGVAVKIAIAKRDLGLVRLLVERSDTGKGGREGRKGRKRRRLQDRVEVNPGMLQLAVKLDARDIVQYLMEKGCVPDMKTLKMVR